MANTISEVVKSIIDNDLSFQDALERGYSNLSAMARLIKPKVDMIMNYDVKIDSIVTSLKRLKATYNITTKDVEEIVANSKIILKTDVAKISLIKSKGIVEKVTKPLAEHYDAFISVSQGVDSITMIFDHVILEKMKTLFIEDVLEVQNNLAAIIVKSPASIIKTPACALVFYNQLGKRHINIEDTISCYTDTIMLVDMDDVAKAFNILSELIRSTRDNLMLRNQS
ncbi:MAG: hypothetical protein QW416_06710 [Candidatus Nitrosocaldaceae archaeon]